MQIAPSCPAGKQYVANANGVMGCFSPVEAMGDPKANIQNWCSKPENAGAGWCMNPPRGSRVFCEVVGKDDPMCDPDHVSQCQVCPPGAGPDVCGVITIPATCTWPNTFCVTEYTNKSNLSREVVKRCGDFNDAYDGWFVDSSDKDLCQKASDEPVARDFSCTFTCFGDNCNQQLKPSDETLYQKYPPDWYDLSK